MTYAQKLWKVFAEGMLHRAQALRYGFSDVTCCVDPGLFLFRVRFKARWVCPTGERHMIVHEHNKNMKI
jgi:hypothetical protein